MEAEIDDGTDREEAEGRGEAEEGAGVYNKIIRQGYAATKYNRDGD